MKHFLALIFITLTICGCRNTADEEEMPAVNEDQLEEVAFMSYGNDMNSNGAKNTQELTNIYDNLQENDTVAVKVKTVINEVCVNKGCWIEIPVGEDQTARVTFKDYAFFLPKNSQGKEVILEGVVYKSKTSKADLQHFAKDGGKSQAEIDAITEDKITLSFEADGAMVESFENPDVFVPANKATE